MKNATDKALIRYLHPGHLYLVLAIGLILFGIVSISTIFLPILSGACALLLIWLWSSSNKAFKSDLAEAKQSGNLHRISSDFSSGQPFFHKKIFLGELCIYGKKCGHIIFYRDIRRFYVSKNKSYQYPSCELKNGKHVSLCQLRVSGSPSQYTVLLQIGNTIRSHNPDVSIDLLS